MARAVVTFALPDGQILESLEFGIQALSDWSPLWPLLRQDYHDTRRDAFRTQGASLQTPWGGYRPEEAQYVAIKGRILGRRITNADQLRWSPGRERLFPSLTSPSHPESVYHATPSSVSLGTRVPHASNHELGVGNAPRHLGGHKIPRRPVAATPGPPLVRRLGERLSVMAAGVASRMEVSSAEVTGLLGRAGVGP